jgi:hypothetical protein
MDMYHRPRHETTHMIKDRERETDRQTDRQTDRHQASASRAPQDGCSGFRKKRETAADQAKADFACTPSVPASRLGGVDFLTFACSGE